MPSSIRRRVPRVWLAAAALLTALPALASDRVATPEGANALRDLIAKLLPARAPGGPDLVSVKPDGAAYVISTDLAAFNGFLSAAGPAVFYEPATLVFRVSEQEDGNWRVAQDGFPKVTTHAGDIVTTADVANYRQTMLIDPKLAWWLSGSASAGKGAVAVRAPDFVETIEFGALKGDYATTVRPDGAISTTVKDEVDDLSVKFAAGGKDKEPVSFSANIQRLAFNVGADGLKSRKAFELWTLSALHRADLAQHEAELKSLLKEFAAPGLKLVEGGDASKVLISSPLGGISLSGAKAAVGVANAGRESAIDATVSIEGLSLPVGLAPPGAADLTPSKVEVAATFKGIDISAAVNEAIADLRLGGPGPAISEEDGQKVAAALLSAGPMRLEFAPSHIVAPAIDADFRGAIRYEIGKVSGAVTIHARNFDKTMAAIKGLGPDIQMKAIPALAMAKGLAKSDSDGSLSWVVELSEDRSIKVNGIPLGKAPE